jgi:hypothetical protein
MIQISIAAKFVKQLQLIRFWDGNSSIGERDLATSCNIRIPIESSGEKAYIYKHYSSALKLLVLKGRDL